MVEHERSYIFDLIPMHFGAPVFGYEITSNFNVSYKIEMQVKLWNFFNKNKQYLKGCFFGLRWLHV